MRDPARLQQAFPALRNAAEQITSDCSPKYNCIAWAMEDTEQWWWPEGLAFWPAGIRRELSLGVFVEAFATRGFVREADASLEPACDKMAIFAIDDEPTHAARQLPNGSWTSKCGPLEDIEHALHVLEGTTYGTVAVILARRRQSDAS
jgi:hypothetical protein